MLADPMALNTAMGTYTYFVNPLDMCAVAIPGRHRAAVAVRGGAAQAATVMRDMMRKLQLTVNEDKTQVRQLPAQQDGGRSARDGAADDDHVERARQRFRNLRAVHGGLV